MRTFLAIPLPVEIKQQISTLIFPIKQQYPGLRWVEEENYHLTLKFLGDISQKQLHALDANLQHARFSDAFSLEFKNFGGFPSLKNMRAFWLGFQGPQELYKLFNNLTEPIKQADIILEKQDTFKPHLTLARIKNQQVQLADMLPGVNIPAFGVKEFYLYKSELKPQGPIYTILKKYPLN